MLCLQNLLQENWGKPALKLCDVLECPNKSPLKNQNNSADEIDDQIKEWDVLNTKFYVKYQGL